MTQERMVEDKIKTYEKGSQPYGLTIGAWTVKWWQWALSTPASTGPLMDETGKDWNINQPPSNVWFLAGNFGNSMEKFPNRVVTFPKGRSVLLPVLNCEANSLEYPDLKTDVDLVKQVVHDVDTVVKCDCIINGIRIRPIRVSSDPEIFPLNIHEDNGFGVKGGGSTRAAADGFWVFLEPVPEGEYTIDFQGSCEFGRLKAGAKYNLTVSN